VVARLGHPDELDLAFGTAQRIGSWLAARLSGWGLVLWPALLLTAGMAVVTVLATLSPTLRRFPRHQAEREENEEVQERERKPWRPHRRLKRRRAIARITRSSTPEGSQRDG
jgi:hypothetical protein